MVDAHPYPYPYLALVVTGALAVIILAGVTHASLVVKKNYFPSSVEPGANGQLLEGGSGEEPLIGKQSDMQDKKGEDPKVVPPETGGSVDTVESSLEQKIGKIESKIADVNTEIRNLKKGKKGGRNDDSDKTEDEQVSETTQMSRQQKRAEKRKVDKEKKRDAGSKLRELKEEERQLEAQRKKMLKEARMKQEEENRVRAEQEASLRFDEFNGDFDKLLAERSRIWKIPVKKRSLADTMLLEKIGVEEKRREREERKKREEEERRKREEYKRYFEQREKERPGRMLTLADYLTNWIDGRSEKYETKVAGYFNSPPYNPCCPGSGQYVDSVKGAVARGVDGLQGIKDTEAFLQYVFYLTCDDKVFTTFSPEKKVKLIDFINDIKGKLKPLIPSSTSET